MKILKRNSIKLGAIALTISSFMLVSCNNDKKKTTESAEETTEIVKKEDNYSKEKETFRTRTYKMKKGQPLVYNLDAKGIVGFDDWQDYTIVSSEINDFRRSDLNTIQKRIKNMNYRIANLGNTIPAYLKTEEVMEDVADIQKEYKELIEDTDASEKEMNENLEEVFEQFDDLQEELDETLEKYIKINEKAIEEFNEEFSKGKIGAAIEEYNEEIKKLDKMIEKK